MRALVAFQSDPSPAALQSAMPAPSPYPFVDECHLFYVAMTRATDMYALTGSLDRPPSSWSNWSNGPRQKSSRSVVSLSRHVPSAGMTACNTPPQVRHVSKLQ